MEDQLEIALAQMVETNFPDLQGNVLHYDASPKKAAFYAIVQLRQYDMGYTMPGGQPTGRLSATWDLTLRGPYARVAAAQQSLPGRLTMDYAHPVLDAAGKDVGPMLIGGAYLTDMQAAERDGSVRDANAEAVLSFVSEVF